MKKKAELNILLQFGEIELKMPMFPAAELPVIELSQEEKVVKLSLERESGQLSSLNRAIFPF